VVRYASTPDQDGNFLRRGRSDPAQTPCSAASSGSAPTRTGEGLAEIEVVPAPGDMLANGVQASDLKSLQAEGQVLCVPGPGDVAAKPLARPDADLEARVRLTTDGLALAERLQDKPWWRTSSLRLWWRGKCVRRLRHDAIHLQHVLVAFEAGGWPPRLLVQRPEGLARNFQNWLRDAVTGLIRRQHPLRLRFFLDGTAAQVCWEAIA
jgi:hypothetical protein